MKRNQKIKLYLFFIFLFLAIVFAILFPRLTLPFGFSYVIYLMVRPFALRLTTGTKKQRVFYSLLLSLGIFLILLPIFMTVYDSGPDLGHFTEQLPEVQKMLQEKFFAIKVAMFEKLGITLNVNPVNYLMQKLERWGSLALTNLPGYISSIFEWFLLVPLFLYFFFFESKNFNSYLMEAIPNPIFEKFYVLISQFNKKFGEYIVAKFVEATFLGTIVSLGLWAINFPYPLLLGLVAGITNILPYVGPILGIIPAILVGLMSKDPNISLYAMIAVFILANLVDMILVFPLLVSKIVNLHPILVVVSVIVGSQLGGVIGMIVIIPFVAFFKLLFKEIYKDLSVHL